MSLLSDVSIAVTPNGYKAEKLYAVVPSSGAADMVVTRATDATRVNEDGLIESILSNVPRIDYTGGGCPHILVEPQRTNRIPNSENGLSWSTSNVTISSQDGGLNSEYFKITSSGVTNRFNVVGFTFINTTAGTYSASVFAKKGTSDEIILTSRATYGAQSAYSVFNLTSGAVVSSSGVTGSIEPYSDGWYRCNINFTNSGGYNDFASFAYGFNFNSNNTDTLFVAAPQSEIGSYTTSYIPTSGSTVTRNQDQFTRNNLASLINSAEGVLFVEAKTTYDSSESRRITLSDGTTNNRVSLEFDESVDNKIKAFITLNGATETLEYTAPDLSIYNKIAIKWKANDFAIWFNGSEVVTEAGESRVPTGLTQLVFDGGNGANFFYGEVKQLQVFKTALSDSQLAALTS